MSVACTYLEKHEQQTLIHLNVQNMDILTMPFAIHGLLVILITILPLFGQDLMKIKTDTLHNPHNLNHGMSSTH